MDHVESVAYVVAPALLTWEPHLLIHNLPPLQQPQIILLKEGTDTSQGTPQLISNINACMALADTVRTTLGPRGMDKLIHDDKVRHMPTAAAQLCRSM